MIATAAEAIETIAAGAVAGTRVANSGGALVEFVAREDGVELKVGIAARGPALTVAAARTSGGRDDRERRILDRFCSLIVDKPLPEAADHGAIYAAASLPDDCAPVEGIRTPRNAGPAFALAERLIRKIHLTAARQFGITSRDNAWYARPNTAWLAKTEEEQAAAITPLLIEVLSAHGLTEDDAWISQIERGRRLTLAFSDTVSCATKPRLMMALERRLRRDTGPLEVFLQDKKDANAIRRL